MRPHVCASPRHPGHDAVVRPLLGRAVGGRGWCRPTWRRGAHERFENLHPEMPLGQDVIQVGINTFDHVGRNDDVQAQPPVMVSRHRSSRPRTSEPPPNGQPRSGRHSSRPTTRSQVGRASRQPTPTTFGITSQPGIGYRCPSGITQRKARRRGPRHQHSCEHSHRRMPAASAARVHRAAHTYRPTATTTPRLMCSTVRRSASGDLHGTRRHRGSQNAGSYEGELQLRVPQHLCPEPIEPLGNQP